MLSMSIQHMGLSSGSSMTSKHINSDPYNLLSPPACDQAGGEVISQRVASNIIAFGWSSKLTKTTIEELCPECLDKLAHLLIEREGRIIDMANSKTVTYPSVFVDPNGNFPMEVWAKIDGEDALFIRTAQTKRGKEVITATYQNAPTGLTLKLAR